MIDAEVVDQLRTMHMQAVRSHKRFTKRLQRQIRLDQAADGAPDAINDMARSRRAMDARVLPSFRAAPAPLPPR
jgi:hypothetical protein